MSNYVILCTIIVNLSLCDTYYYSKFYYIIRQSYFLSINVGVICLNNWYTRKEVAELLGVSKATVYHYAKQKKIIKIDDPHRLFREARYKKDEVDILAEERRRNTPTGWRPSELANELNVPTQRIYTLIRETHLPVKQLPAGDERMIYSIPEETAEWIRKEVQKTKSPRGSRVEFYDSQYDIALFQLFKAANDQEMRVMRNNAQEWGFKLPSGTWIPYADGRDIFQYEPVYTIHQENQQVNGYTDFLLDKDNESTFVFLDFVYTVWGIENIRLREKESTIELSIKSGTWAVSIPMPTTLNEDKIQNMLVQGNVIIEEEEWTLVSGYRRTTFDLPSLLLENLRKVAAEERVTMSEYVEAVLQVNLEERQAAREEEQLEN